MPEVRRHDNFDISFALQNIHDVLVVELLEVDLFVQVVAKAGLILLDLNLKLVYARVRHVCIAP